MSSETANDLLAELAAERAARAKTVLGETSVLRCAEPVPGPGPQKRQKLPKSGDGKQPAVSAEVVDLCDDSDDAEVVEVGRTLVYGDEQWRSEAASLALAQQLQEEDAAADASAALARRLQQEDDAGRAGGVGSGACCSFYSEAFPPWPATVTWTEAQHSKEPNACGNFPICHRKNGSSFFFSGPPLNGCVHVIPQAHAVHTRLSTNRESPRARARGRPTHTHTHTHTHAHTHTSTHLAAHTSTHKHTHTHTHATHTQHTRTRRTHVARRAPGANGRTDDNNPPLRWPAHGRRRAEAAPWR
jgi:hypothetical protein